jgi:hypothetical protein
MPAMNVNELISNYPNITTEQMNLFIAFYTKFDNGNANKHIINVEPLYFQGAVGFTEFNTYDVKKLYLALSFKIPQSDVRNTSPSVAKFYDENNVLCHYLGNNSLLYNSVANDVEYNANRDCENNFYFSWFTSSYVTHFIFNGFRITLN